MAKLKKLLEFVTVDIWRIRLRDLSAKKAFLLKQLRIILLAFRGYKEDSCQFRASALTFYTLLSIVPVIAMIFGIAKGFGIETKVESLIEANLQQPEISEKLITFSNSMLESTKGGLVAGIGIVILFWTIIKVLGNIEKSFNYIWGVKRPRHLGRKFTDYISVMLVCPILMVLSSSATVFIAAQIRQLTSGMGNHMGGAVEFLLRLLPYCTLWIVFSFIFIFLPNTKIRFKSGIIAGIITGTLFQIMQILYIKFQIGAAKYGAVYGSFAALPLFLIWLQLSWFIVLLGAEISFAHQNVDTYEFEKDCGNISYQFNNKISLLVMSLLVRWFRHGKKPLLAEQIAHQLDMPIRLIRSTLHNLVESGMASEVLLEDEGKDTGFQPARDTEKLTTVDVLNALAKRGSDDNIPMAHSDKLIKINRNLKDMDVLVKNCPANMLIKNI